MAYIGQGIKQGTFKVLDTSGNTYNGSNTTFNLGTQVGSAAQLLVSHDGVIQKAGTDYTLATGGTQITFSTAPASGASIFITEISGAVGGTVTPSDTSVTADKLNSALLTGHTDIGANIADADLFLTDDGAGGTLRKTAASRLKTYVGAGAGAFDIGNLDIDGGTDIGAYIVDADLFIIDDGAGGTNRKTAASRIKTYVGGGTHVKLLAGSASSAVNHDLTGFISSTYHCYLVLLSKVTGLQGNTLDFQFADNSGPFTGSNYFDAAHGFRSNSSDRFTQGGENQAQARLGSGLDASSIRTGSYFFYIYVNPNGAAFSCSASGHNWGYRADYGDYIHADFTLGMDNSNTVTGFRVHAQGNDATTFDYQIYGIAK